MRQKPTAGERCNPIGRRDLVAMPGAAAAILPVRSLAQAGSGLPLVGVLWPGRPEIEVDFDAAMRDGLKEGGFVEGTNFALAMRYANADFERFVPLAAELAALKPQVIVAAPEAAVLVVHQVAPTVPLVGPLPNDPVATGLVASFARPGGTVTGMTTTAKGGEEALTGKRLGLLKELVPDTALVGLMLHADSPESAALRNGAEAAGSRLGMKILPLRVRTLDDVEAAFAFGLRAGAGAFLIDDQPLMISNRSKVAELAARAGKPTMGMMPEQARAGLLASYGSGPTYAWHRYGSYAAKILAGDRPGDLPIEQERTFLFVINLKTAQALRITVPPRFMTLADELVE
jgi:putative ABC transport system substrate-binding protein